MFFFFFDPTVSTVSTNWFVQGVCTENMKGYVHGGYNHPVHIDSYFQWD